MERGREIKELENQLRSIWINRLILVESFFSEGETIYGAKIEEKDENKMVLKLTENIKIVYNLKNKSIKVEYVNKGIDREKALKKALDETLKPHQLP